MAHPADFTEEAKRIVLRIRGMLAEGKPNKDIAADVGVTPSAVSNIKANRKWTKPKIQLAYFLLRFPNPNEKCTKCLKEPKLMTKDDTCLECACIELNKLNFLFVDEPKQQGKKEPT